MSTRAQPNATLLAQYHAMLNCPLCSQGMDLIDGKSLICANRHCFDLAKQGYVNFLTHGIKTKYDKKMFTSRRALSESGFFEPLDHRLAEIIVQLTRNNPSVLRHQLIKVLDAGCGEGSHLASIEQYVKQNLKQDQNFAGFEILGVGMDIAKEGISLAAKRYPHLMWCVADLGKCPFKSSQFDIILNILSPSNYDEFQRLLTADGVVIKVVPETDYLQELRTVFYDKTGKEEYANTKTLALFREHLELLDHQRVHYTVTIENPLIEHLVQMTPLSWNVAPQAVAKVLAMPSLEITVDLRILVGKYPAQIPQPKLHDK